MFEDREKKWKFEQRRRREREKKIKMHESDKHELYNDVHVRYVLDCCEFICAIKKSSHYVKMMMGSRAISTVLLLLKMKIRKKREAKENIFRQWRWLWYIACYNVTVDDFLFFAHEMYIHILRPYENDKRQAHTAHILFAAADDEWVTQLRSLLVALSFFGNVCSRQDVKIGMWNGIILFAIHETHRRREWAQFIFFWSRRRECTFFLGCCYSKKWLLHADDGNVFFHFADGDDMKEVNNISKLENTPLSTYYFYVFLFFFHAQKKHFTWTMYPLSCWKKYIWSWLCINAVRQNHTV